jgi:hypothetical protein
VAESQGSPDEQAEAVERLMAAVRLVSPESEAPQMAAVAELSVVPVLAVAAVRA